MHASAENPKAAVGDSLAAPRSSECPKPAHCLQDICTRGWGLQHIAYLNTGGFDAPVELYTNPKDKAAFTPHTRVWVGASADALICSFRGSEPTNLINFRSSGRIDLVPQEGALSEVRVLVWGWAAGLAW